MGVFCDVCNLTVSSDAVMKDHIKGKKHLRLLDIQKRQQQQAERSVYVRGFSYGIKDIVLKNYFSKYGAVDSVFVDRERGSYAIIEFRSRDSVAKLLQPGGDLYMGARKLIIKPREVKAYVPKKKQDPSQENSETGVMESPSYDLEDVLADLAAEKNVGDQMMMLKEKLKLTKEDYQQRDEICQNLQLLAKPIFPYCQVHQFGSSVNGFGMRGCDMDIFLDLNLDVLYDQDVSELPYIKDIKSLKVENGKISHQSLKDAPWRDRIKLVGRLLCGTELFGKDVLTIPSARCPVVKVTHQNSGIKCDISINNRMALRNTKLLQLLGSEARLGPLTYAVRLWAKCKELSGQGPRLTSYALTLLVIFYLQQTNPPVLPSIKKLAELTADEDRVCLDQWDCSFPSHLPPTENKATVEELLQGFFTFYSSFDFSSSVISIREGRAEDVAEFRDKALANALMESFKFGAVCVQDPFVLEHNTTLNVNVKVKSQLVSEFQEAVAKCSHDKFTDTAADLWGIPFLLSEEEVRKVNTLEETLTPTHMSYMLEIIYNPTSLSMEVLREASKLEERKRTWVTRLVQLYQRLLRDVILCEPEPGVMESSETDKHASESSLTSKHLGNGVANNTESSAKYNGPGTKCSKSDDGQSVYSNQVTSRTDSDKLEPVAMATCLEKQCNNSMQSNAACLCATDHASTKRSLSHESAIISSDSKKSRSEPTGKSCQLNGEGADLDSSDNNNKTSAITPTDKIVLRSKFLTYYRMWTGRKKAKSKIRGNCSNLDLVDFEVKVTEELKKVAALKSKEVVFSFETAVVYHEDRGQTETRFYLHPLTGAKEFSCFYPFFRSFFIKIADKQIF